METRSKKRKQFRPEDLHLPVLPEVRGAPLFYRSIADLRDEFRRVAQLRDIYSGALEYACNETYIAYENIDPGESFVPWIGQNLRYNRMAQFRKQCSTALLSIERSWKAIKEVILLLAKITRLEKRIGWRPFTLPNEVRMIIVNYALPAHAPFSISHGHFSRPSLLELRYR